jgi:hypothetical protein
MLTRVALLAASLTASAVLVIGLALFGLVPPSPAIVPATGTDQSVAAVSQGEPQPVTQIDTVYVVPPTPTPTPEPTPSPIIIQRVVTTGGGEHEDGGGDDD